MNKAEKIDKPQGNGVLPCVSISLPSKEQIKKTLYECAIITQTDEGVKMERIFDKEADAILRLFTGNEC